MDLHVHRSEEELVDEKTPPLVVLQTTSVLMLLSLCESVSSGRRLLNLVNCVKFGFIYLFTFLRVIGLLCTAGKWLQWSTEEQRCVRTLGGRAGFNGAGDSQQRLCFALTPRPFHHTEAVSPRCLHELPSLVENDTKGDNGLPHPKVCTK